MESKDGKTSKHPLAGFVSKCTRLVANLVYDNPDAVKYFEAEMNYIGDDVVTHKARFRERRIKRALTALNKYLIDQSQAIRDSLSKLTLLDVESEGKDILEKVGLTNKYFMDKNKVTMVESPFTED
eukprot:CAMPEP_0168320346 /NCGR_PEP_ID=MMETSP0213-20121227/1607_1 /TAXON_ID=151035 /ORGANISM="Euplotes harpa, Strain FSP1.4" /LENGTH=125 /DNA_ID=CAMNT_0008321761 /DNA_START=1401 /DNA_END=1778 /DNA_ORIENTATION=+